MVYVIDIDGTICSLPRQRDGQSDYSMSEPLKGRIEKFNKLFEDGHTIIYYTARGMGRTNNDRRLAHEMFYDVTKKQLRNWDVKFHDLILGKPAADVYVDDKAVNINDFK